MPENVVNKFLKNELLGIKQALRNIFLKPLRAVHNKPHIPPEEITPDYFPAEFKITKDISEKAKVFPKAVILTGDREDTGGQFEIETGKLNIDRGNLKSEENFVGTYAHELGHAKYTKLHSRLNLGYFNIPYKLLMSATTSLYGLGLSSYAFMGNNKVLESANWLTGHTGKYLLAGVIVNAAIKRTREYMADLFAYNQTGLLPSQYEGEEKRAGIIGNVSQLLGNTYHSLKSGYPVIIERDVICKILGNKPKDISFVEKLKTERAQKNNAINEIRG